MLTALVTVALIQSESTSVNVHFRGGLSHSFSNYCKARHNTGSTILTSGAIVVRVAAPPNQVWEWAKAYQKEFGGTARKDDQGRISLVADYTEGQKTYSPPIDPERLRRKVKRTYNVWNAVSYAIKTGSLMKEDRIESLTYVYAPTCKSDGTKGLYFYSKLKLWRDGKPKFIGL